ncbi:SMP-30/gluconolactonase/LRE family protein [uncultured Sphingomonas sp.]|uniref:SMP-30/gluconolactonase/LRE family protein n=1 Tax=uncultured Sphingomonas sp. TaxID=158754 RepID=UPI0035CC398F
MRGPTRRATILGGLASALLAGRLDAQATPGLVVLADGLAFPEGIVALRDSGTMFVEIAAGTYNRLRHGSRTPETIATLGGGPNGSTIGPDGMVYVANDGGLTFTRIAGRHVPTGVPADYRGGSIQQVNPATGAVRTLYESVGTERLKAPNDIVCDEWGDLWFTDTGKTHARTRDNGGLYWAKRDGSDIREVAYPIQNPNGLALGPDRRTLYVALSDRREIAAYTIAGRGMLAGGASPSSRIVAAVGGVLLFDNLAVEANGNLVVACVQSGELLSLSPDGRELGRVRITEGSPTALAFGGADQRTLYMTLSNSGIVARMAWPRPGLTALHRL